MREVRDRSDAERFGLPFEPELGRRRHEAEQRGGRDDGGAREVALAAETHAVLPVAIERRDRALAASSARPAPARSTGRTTTAESRRRPSGTPRAIDSPPSRGSGRSICRPTPPDPGKIANSRSTLRSAARARAAQHERRLQQIVVAAVGAGSDHRLVERDALARDLVGRKRIARAERLGDHRLHVRQIERFVDLVGRIRAGRDRRIRQDRRCPSRDTTSYVMSSGAKMPFSASASAIMLAIVLRYAIGSCRSASTSSTDIPCDCFAPHRRSSSRTMSLPLTQGCRRPRNITRRCSRQREVDVAGRPAEAEGRRADADADGAVGAIGAAVGVGARE